MSFSIAGKTAIVTGAANGIGLAIARKFFDQGANVMLADMENATLQEEATQLGEKDDEDASRVRHFAGDLRERLTLANLLSATIDAFERVDILVNASRQMMTSDPLDPDADAMETMLSQNLTAPLRLSQLVARRMIKQAEDDENDGISVGSIINLSSIAARRTHPDLLGYSVSCAALDQMTRSMAVALAPHRIRVNALSFGSVMSASLKGTLKDRADYRDDIREHTPMGRIAKPTEVADAAQFLASGAGAFMTGQILTIDGGRTLLDPVQAPAH